MSLYNLMFGRNPASDVILSALEAGDVGRFRDCWVEKAPDGSFRVAVYTRNGGGNREHSYYADVEEGPGCDCTGCTITYRIPQHPLYLFDTDDDYDSTYATVYYSLPEKYEADLRAIALDEPRDPSAAWVELLAAISKPTGEQP